jgi:hypothetical protein
MTKPTSTSTTQQQHREKVALETFLRAVDDREPKNEAAIKLVVSKLVSVLSGHKAISLTCDSVKGLIVSVSGVPWGRKKAMTSRYCWGHSDYKGKSLEELVEPADALQRKKAAKMPQAATTSSVAAKE